MFCLLRSAAISAWVVWASALLLPSASIDLAHLQAGWKLTSSTGDVWMLVLSAAYHSNSSKGVICTHCDDADVEFSCAILLQLVAGLPAPRSCAYCICLSLPLPSVGPAAAASSLSCAGVCTPLLPVLRSLPL